jgi:hypothetical protein
MKKSRAVRISLVSSLAGAALGAGCGSSHTPPQQGWQACVDRVKGTAIEQRYCDDEASRQGTPGYVPHYGWYYYPRSYYWEAPVIGSPVPTGGSFGARPFDSVPMARTGSVVRGGLGSTASGHAGSGESGHSGSGE